MISTVSERVNADVVVLGGGIIGAAVARELSSRGVGVVLVEATGPGAGSSGRCDGNVLVQTKHDELGMRLTLRSITAYQRWMDELGPGIRFEQQGSLVFCTDEEQAAQARADVDGLRAVGVRADFIGPEEVRRREPHLRGEVAGAIDCYDDSSVYPPAVVAALVKEARATGCRVLSGARAQRLLVDEAGRTRGVQTDSGTISAPTVVNAMGVWAPELDTDGRVPLPVRPRQGVLVVTEEAPGLVNRAVTEGVYRSNRTSAGKGSEAMIAFVAEPTYRGNILLGSSRRFCGYDTRVEPEIFQAIVERSVRFMPALARVRAIRSFAGLRPWTPDNKPLVGEVEHVPGYVLATGHEGEGIGLAPVTAELAAAAVLQESVTGLLDEARRAFAPARLTQARPAPTEEN